MDIAKYIGLFLLKNHFCYVHGFGNIEIKKRPATFDDKALQSPSYEVTITQGGSIDDNLANFIATNEQISISKAANELRDYTIQARKDLAAGKEVPIPNIGKFIQENDQITFITDANFQYTPAGIPTIRNSRQLEEQNAKIPHKPSYPQPQKADSLNWNMVILVIVLLIVIGSGAYGIYYYTTHKNATTSVSIQDTVIKTESMTGADTTNINKDTTAIATQSSTPVDSMQMNEYKMIIGNYPTQERAEHRVRNLQVNGDHVSMIKMGPANFLVITTINCRPVDTLHVEDSLQILFGYKPVMTLK